jgi:hypothetical protein
MTNYRNKPIRGANIGYILDDNIKKKKNHIVSIKLSDILYEKDSKLLCIIKKLLELFIFGMKGEGYKMDKLTKDIKTEGYKPQKYGYVIVKRNKNNLYKVIEGHHRVKVLRKLYGNDYSIDVKVII